MTPETEDRASSPRPRRGSRPRFGLRTLLVVAVLFCLFFAWIGKRYYELRQDEAAIEALKRGGAGFLFAESMTWETETPLVAFDDSGADWERARIVLGLSERPRLRSAALIVREKQNELRSRALAALQRFPELEEVTLLGDAFDDAAIEEVADLPNLKELWLSRTSVTGAGLAPLAERRSLQVLNYYSEHPPDDILPGLARLRSLRIVNFSGDEFVDRAEIEALASLPKLENLRMYDVTPSDETDLLLPLEQAGSLKVLVFISQGSEPYVGQASRLPSLEELSLWGMADETVTTWPVTPTLEEAQFNSSVTPAAVAAFSAAHPTCDVHYFQGNLTSVTYRGGEPLK